MMQYNIGDLLISHPCTKNLGVIIRIDEGYYKELNKEKPPNRIYIYCGTLSQPMIYGIPDYCVTGENGFNRSWTKIG